MRDDPPPADRASAAPTARSVVAGWLVGLVVVLGALINALVGLLSFFAPTTFLTVIGHRGEPLTEGVRIFAAYTGARDLAVAVALAVLLAMRSRRVLPGLLATVAAANALDGVAALAFRRWAQVPGSFVFALAFVAAAIWLFKQPGGKEAI